MVVGNVFSATVLDAAELPLGLIVDVLIALDEDAVAVTDSVAFSFAGVMIQPAFMSATGSM